MKKVEMARFKRLNYACSEAINTLCTNLIFMGSDVKRIMFTSCTAHEGKSFISMNVMRTFAELGHRVLLIDSDLRRSQVNARYGLRFEDGETNGLAHYLAGMCQLEDVIYQTDIDGAYILPSGYAVSNSLALLNSHRFGEMMRRVEDQFDFILVDAPPVGTIIDAAEIAKNCDGSVFVVKYNAVSRRELANARVQLEMSGCKTLGVVLNDVEFDTLSSKRYYNKSYYARYDSDYYKPKQKKRKLPL